MVAVRTEWPVNWENDIPPSGDSILVGDPRWCFLIPRLHAALASGTADVVFPKLADDVPTAPVCAFWETAYYMLRHLLRWTDPGLGLRWWWLARMPHLDDERLRLLKTIWASDRDFPLFMAWCWTSAPRGWKGEATFEDRRSFESFGSEPLARVVARRFKENVARGTGLHPFAGEGYNPLHLGHSCEFNGYQEPPLYELFRADERGRNAVLMLDRAIHWPQALAIAGATLPDLGDRSWHVHVVVKPMGWLGVFRRSRVTGLWFQGRHSVHMAGQPDRASEP